MGTNIKYILLIFFLCLVAQNVSAAERIFYMSEKNLKDGIESLKKNSDKIDILAPQFYGVSSKLNLTGSIPNELKKLIKEKQKQVMPLVTNYAFKQEIIHNLLASKTAQEKVINQLIAEAKKEKYIGWQFDFENINYKDRDNYSAFVEKAGELFHKNGLIFSVAVVSRNTDYEDTDFYKNWSGAFDYARLAKAVDFVSLMTYDDPNSLGPVASVPYVNKVLNYVKNVIPPEKLSLGIPLYNWKWEADSFKKVASYGSYGGLLYVTSNFSCNIGYDNLLGSSWLSYFWQDKQYKLWYQGKKDFQNKLDIAKRNSLRGFSAWVLGPENPEIWTAL